MLLQIRPLVIKEVSGAVVGEQRIHFTQIGQEQRANVSKKHNTSRTNRNTKSAFLQAEGYDSTTSRTVKRAEAGKQLKRDSGRMARSTAKVRT